ncbi:MAG: hypothetical protein PF638_07730 [Candidatus Delongbacteria bacterium]|jgi:hypothetical protein|nr:hypothetical protein [Candidatus Delongbacteria bacterium]
MKKFVLLLIVVLSFSFLGCGGSSTEKEAIKAKDNSTPVANTVEKKEKKLPEGFPKEFTFPFDLARRMTTGSGTGSRIINKNGDLSFGKEQTFKSYSIWESMPKNVPEIISHYKKLMTDLDYEGEWKGDGIESAYGVFKKGDNEFELKVSSEQFKFGLKIWGAEVVK